MNKIELNKRTLLISFHNSILGKKGNRHSAINGKDVYPGFKCIHSSYSICVGGLKKNTRYIIFK